MVNGTQTLKADNMVYDAVTKIVTLRGNATVADGQNIQRGEVMTYNTETASPTSPAQPQAAAACRASSRRAANPRASRSRSAGKRS